MQGNKAVKRGYCGRYLTNSNPAIRWWQTAYCTYWLVAACKNKGANIVMKNHHKREDNPLGARQLNQHERTTGGLKPQRRDWMSEQEYDAMPEQVEIRLVDIVINQAGLQ